MLTFTGHSVQGIFLRESMYILVAFTVFVRTFMQHWVPRSSTQPNQTSELVLACNGTPAGIVCLYTGSRFKESKMYVDHLEVLFLVSHVQSLPSLPSP